MKPLKFIIHKNRQNDDRGKWLVWAPRVQGQFIRYELVTEVPTWKRAIEFANTYSWFLNVVK